jgi:hypothetical protein
MKKIHSDGTTEFDPRRDDAPSVIIRGAAQWHQQGRPSWCRLAPGRNWDKMVNRAGTPATVWPDGTVHWARGGSFHREEGPACAWPDGTSAWWWRGDPLRHPKGPSLCGPGRS